jgi:hypothetical protein
MLKTRVITAMAFFALVCSSAFAQELVISGRVLDTGGSDKDLPIFGVTVQLFDAKNNEIGKTLTNRDGRFHIELASAALVNERGVTKVSLGGYAANPTSVPLKLRRPAGMKLALQEVVFLVNEEKIRASADYRSQVARTAARARDAVNEPERAGAVYLSIASLPPESRELVLSSVRAESVRAHAEILQVRQELTRARELEDLLRQNFSPNIEVLLRQSGGKLRFSGTVDDILRQAGEKGFTADRIVNDLRVLRTP